MVESVGSAWDRPGQVRASGSGADRRAAAEQQLADGWHGGQRSAGLWRGAWAVNRVRWTWHPLPGVGLRGGRPLAHQVDDVAAMGRTPCQARTHPHRVRTVQEILGPGARSRSTAADLLPRRDGMDLARCGHDRAAWWQPVHSPRRSSIALAITSSINRWPPTSIPVGGSAPSHRGANSTMNGRYRRRPSGRWRPGCGRGGPSTPPSPRSCSWP